MQFSQKFPGGFCEFSSFLLHSGDHGHWRHAATSPAPMPPPHSLLAMVVHPTSSPTYSSPRSPLACSLVSLSLSPELLRFPPPLSSSTPSSRAAPPESKAAARITVSSSPSWCRESIRNRPNQRRRPRHRPHPAELRRPESVTAGHPLTTPTTHECLRVSSASFWHSPAPPSFPPHPRSPTVVAGVTVSC